MGKQLDWLCLKSGVCGSIPALPTGGDAFHAHQPVLPELKRGATVATETEEATATRSIAEPMTEKPRKRPREVSDEH